MSETQKSPPSLRALILEDLESDAILMARELRKAGYLVSWKRVETEKAFLEALDLEEFDVILSDYTLPSYNASRALTAYQDRRIAIPFIVVTGSLGEEQAVALMKLGASDYLIKDRLARLGGAVSAALEQKRLRDERQGALAQLRASEERFRRLTENAPDLRYRCSLGDEPRIEYLNPTVEKMTGYTAAELYAQPAMAMKFIQPGEGKSLEESIHGPYTLRWMCKDGAIIWAELRNVPVYDDHGKMIAVEGVARDITERVLREREREAIISVAAALRGAMSRAEIVAVMLDKAADLLKADGAALGSFDVESGTVRVEMGLGIWEGWHGQRLSLSSEIVRQVLVEVKPYLCSDIAQNPEMLPPGGLVGSGLAVNNLVGSALAANALAANALASIRGLICVPLREQDQETGILWVGCRAPFHPQDQPEENMKLLVAIADIGASSLHRARLYEETQQRVQHLTALRTIDRAITASLDLHLTMKILLDQLMVQKEVGGVDILLVDPYSHQLKVADARGIRGRSIEGSQERVNESLAGRAILDRRALNIPRLEDFPQSFPQKELFLSEGFHAYLGVPLIAKGEVLGVLEILRRSTKEDEPDWLEFIEALASQVAIAINTAGLFEQQRRTSYEILQAYDATIEGWARALETRGIEMRGHTNRVVQLTIELARLMKVPEAELVHLKRGALLHDIGTLALPDNTLLKPDLLTDEERALMRRHPVYAYEWLSPIIYLNPALDIPYCHHEAWNGSGYPRGLAGVQIPLAARIFSVVDVWDALRSDRPFRKAWPREQAYTYIQQMAGIQFDPAVVEVFLKLANSEPGFFGWEGSEE